MTEYLLLICMFSILLNFSLYFKLDHEKRMKEIYFDMIESYRVDTKFYKTLAKTYKNLLGFNKEEE